MDSLRETPRKSRSTSESNYAKGGLEGARDAVMEDVGSIPEVDDVNHLFAAVLAKSLFRASSQNPPPADTSHIRSFPTDEAISSALVPDAVVDSVMNKLRTSGVLTPNNGWRSFPREPSAMDESEAVAFSGLLDLFNDIVAASPYATSNLLKLELKGREALLPDHRVNTAPPDAYMLLKSSSIPETIRQRKDSWADIPVILELKNKDTEYTQHDVRPFFFSKTSHPH